MKNPFFGTFFVLIKSKYSDIVPQMNLDTTHFAHPLLHCNVDEKI